MKFLVVLFFGLVVSCTSYCSRAAEPEINPQPLLPHYAPDNAIGAMLYKLCGDVIAVVWVQREIDNVALLTISPDYPKFEFLVKDMEKFMKNGAPITELELKHGCKKT